MSTVEIIPAVLPKNVDELERGLLHLRGVAPLVQIDLVGSNVLARLEEMPLWAEFDFEFDIMLESPSHEVRRCIELGASRIVVHADALDAREAMQMLQETRQGDFAIAAGIALAAHDTPEALLPFEGLFDYVQVMGIDRIGVQSEPPDPHHHELLLVRALRARYPSMPIQVDGAAAAHPKELRDAGASRLIVGSALMSADNPKEEIKRLYNLSNVRS